MDDVLARSCASRKSKFQAYLPWLVSALGAIIGGIGFCLADCGSLSPKLLAGSVGWGAVPGMLILLASLFFARTESSVTERASRPLSIASLFGLFIGALMGAILLIFICQFVQFFSTTFRLDGLGNLYLNQGQEFPYSI
jgi:hypothetical protein